MTERSVHDLKLSPAQLRAVEHGRRMIELQRLRDECAASALASTNAPLKPLPWYRRVLNRIGRWFS